MNTRQALIDGLADAGIDVDPTGTVRRYADGITYILTEPAALTERRTHTVIAVVGIGRDLDTYADTVTAAIATIEGMIALNQTPAYAEEPIPGRDMPPADLMRITVATNQLWH